MSDIVRPTNYGILDPIVTNPTLGYNGNLGNRALLKEDALGGVAEYYLVLWEAGTIDPTKRLSVTLNVNARFNSAAAFPDRLTIYFRVRRLDPWLIIDSQFVTTGLWPQQPGAAIWRQFDLTLPAGITPNVDFELLFQFFNDAGTPDEPPTPHDP